MSLFLLKKNFITFNFTISNIVSFKTLMNL